MKIGSREVGPGAPVFVVAEIASSHGGSLDRALALIDAAADAGADAAKFQRFRVDHFLVPRPDPEALRRYELPDEWLPKLVARCDERGIEFLCTAFDLASLDVVDPFVNAHKIGSAEAPTREYGMAVYHKGKPTLISLGMAKGWDWFGPTDAPPYVTLHCVSKYPAAIEDYHLKDHFVPRGGWWGVSDHTLHPTIVPAAATSLGACIVEKHFCGDEVELTPDSPVSITRRQFAAMVEAIRLTEAAVRG